MAGYCEVRTKKNDWMVYNAIETNNWEPNSPYAAEARTLLEAMRHPRREKCNRWHKKIICITDYKILSKVLNKKVLTCADMTQDTESIVREIVRIIEKLKIKVEITHCKGDFEQPENMKIIEFNT